MKEQPADEADRRLQRPPTASSRRPCPQLKPSSLSAKTETLLLELGEECQRVLTEAQRETLLGELSAAVLHLNEHTRGLDSIIDSEG